jgi:L-asparagine transporter-like permease
LADAALAVETPKLTRSLRTRHIAMISIGGIIGAGLFVNSINAIAAIGPAVIVSYVLTGLIVLFVMRMLGEMAMAYPETGAFTEFPRLAMGNLAGFTSGWLYWYFWVIVVAFEAIAGASIIKPWLPDIPTWVTGLVLTVLLTASNLLSTRNFGEFEFWFSSIKVAAIIAFIVIALSYALGVNPTGGMTFSNWTNDGGFAPMGLLPVVAGVTSLIFTLVGAEIAGPGQRHQNRSFRPRISPNVAAALPACPIASCISGRSARRNGLVANSRSSSAGTVGRLSERRFSIQATYSFSALFSGSIVTAKRAFDAVYSCAQ